MEVGKLKIFGKLLLWLLCITVISGSFPINASANESLSLEIHQVSINKPEITVYFDLPEESPALNNFTDDLIPVSANLGGEELTPVSFIPFNESNEGVWYIFTVDVSGSMTSAQITAIRNSISDLAENMNTNDRFTLITFGLTVDILINLSNDAEEIINTANSMPVNQRGTLFYNSIVEAFELASQYGADIPERRAVFVFSDAEDYNVGGFIQQEVEDILEKTDISLYAMGFNNATRDALDAFGAKARLTPGGGIDIVTANTVRNAVNTRVENMNSGYVARFTSKTNTITGEPETLTVTFDHPQHEAYESSITVTAKRWIPDNSPPEVVSARQTASETIRIEFSKPMSGANTPENYQITDSDGNLLALSTVSYIESENTVTITFVAQPKSGNITVSFPGITDDSMEKNTIQRPVIIDFSGIDPTPEVTPTPEPLPIPEPADVPEPISPLVWMLLALAVALIVLGAAFAVIKSRGGLVRIDGKLRFAGNKTQEVYITEEEAQAAQYKFITTKAPEINLRVMDGAGRTKDLSIPVQGSLFIGRAAGNDLVFDDKRMSRQHFAIEAKEGTFHIMNLSESSGTMLNGVKLNSARMLNTGDKIEAGNITFTIL